MKSKKIWGAVCAGLGVILYYGLIIGIVLYAEFSSNDNMPLVILCIILGLIGIPLCGVLYSMISRIKEIQSGEEEEAKKY